MTSDDFREARTLLGLSIEQLAEALKTDPRGYRRLEAGERSPSGPMVLAMAYLLDDALDVDIDLPTWATDAIERARKIAYRD